jgi:hypothetical protein
MIVDLLTKDPKVQAAQQAAAQKKNKPTATPPAKPNTMTNAPVSKTNTAKPGNPNAAPAATPPGKKPAATSTTSSVQQKTLTSKGFGQMVNQLGARPS